MLTRGSAQCTFDTGETYGDISPSYDVSIYNSPYSDCVMKAGDNFELQYSQSSLLASFNQGSKAKVGGASWALIDDVDITLPSNQTFFICLTINKANQDGSKCDITFKTMSQIQFGCLYGDDNVRDMPIYQVTTSSSGISSLNDLRFIVADCTALPESWYEIIDKRNYAIYDEFED